MHNNNRRKRRMCKISSVADGLRLQVNEGHSFSSSSSSSGSITLPVGGTRVQHWMADIISWWCIRIMMVRGIG